MGKRKMEELLVSELTNCKWKYSFGLLVLGGWDMNRCLKFNSILFKFFNLTFKTRL